MSFRLTYATMFNPPEEMHERFEKALATMRSRLGKTHPMHIDGKDVPAGATEERRSPIDNQILIGRFPSASAQEVDAALAAAQRAFPGWRDAGMEKRVALMRKVARILEERVYEIAAALVADRLETDGEGFQTVLAFLAQQAMDVVDGFRVADRFQILLGVKRFACRRITLLTTQWSRQIWMHRLLNGDEDFRA